MALRGWFFSTPISPDEGGYLTIARAWRHGATLYRDVWIDRPQGLILIYRVFDMLGGTAGAVRILSLIAAVMTIVGIAELVRWMSDERSGIIAACVAALLCTAPAIDGFAANGELLGGACCALSLGLASRVLAGRSHRWWMAAAGALAAFGVTIKQSSADGLATLVLFLIVLSAFGLVGRREAVGHLSRCVAGAAVVLGTSVLHGAATGWHRYYYAILGYRAGQRSVLQHPNWQRFHLTAHDVVPILRPAVLVSAVALVLVVAVRPLRRLRPNSRQLLLPIWGLLSVAMFYSGGQFFHHYWLTLTYPLAAICGLLVGALAIEWVQVGLAGGAVLAAASSWLTFARLDRAEVWPALDGEGRPMVAEQLGDWLPTVMQPGDTLFAMCSMPSLYAVAGKDPVYPYFWWDSVHHPDGAQQRLIELFAGEHPPTWVPLVQTTHACNPSGAVAAMFAARYHEVAVVDRVAVYHVND